MDSVVTYLIDELRVVASAPIVFLLSAVIVAWGAYRLARHHFGERINTLNSRISHRDERILDYERKLEGASPDEARGKIEALESELARLRPRRLDAAQSAELTRRLARSSGTVVVGYDLGVPDGARFQDDLAQAFHKAGWNVQAATFAGTSTQTGVAVWMKGASEAAEVALSALTSLGVDFNRTNQKGSSSETDFEILIYHRP